MCWASFLIWFHQPPGPIGFDKLGNSRFLQRGPQLVELFRTGQQGKFTVLPSVVDGCGMARRANQGGHKDIGIEGHAHQALPAFPRARRSARTSRTAASTMRCNSSGRALALRVLMS